MCFIGRHQEVPLQLVFLSDLDYKGIEASYKSICVNCGKRALMKIVFTYGQHGCTEIEQARIAAKNWRSYES